MIKSKLLGVFSFVAIITSDVRQCSYICLEFEAWSQ